MNPPPSTKNITYILSIDISSEDAGSTLARYPSTCSTTSLSTATITAGYFATETLAALLRRRSHHVQNPRHRPPTLLVAALVTKTATPPSLHPPGSKVVLLSSESGSTGLRHGSGGGGNHARRASKAGLNMCGKPLGLGLKERGGSWLGLCIRGLCTRG